MNYLQKKILTIAAGIANIALSLAVAATATFAWFATQNQVTAEALEISTSAPESTLTWKILSFDDDSKQGIPSVDADDFYLRPYDRFVTNKNVHSNVLLRAEFDLSKTTFTSANQIYIDIYCKPDSLLDYTIVHTDGDDLDELEDGVPSVTSNICQFKSTIAAYSLKATPTTFTNDTITNPAIHDETNPGQSYGNNDEYESATDFFKKTNLSSNKFVTLHNQTPLKRSHKITVIPKFDCGANTVGKAIIYLECSYNPELVEYYQLTHPNLSGEISLSGDIEKVDYRIGRSYTGSYVEVRSASDLTTHTGTLADGTASSTSDDYLIINNSEDVSFDSANYNQTYGYRDVHNRAARIINDENTFNTRWNYDSESHLKTSNGTTYGNGSQTNTLTYQSTGTYTGYVNAVSNGQKIQYDNSENVTAFGYSSTDKENVQFYKYNNTASLNPTLTGIVLGGIDSTEYLNFGTEFSFRGTVTAEYSDGTHVDVTDRAAFTGYNTSSLTRQKVTVSFTDEGVLQTAYYYLEIVDAPYIEMDYPLMTGGAGTHATNTIIRHNFRSNSMTYTWTSSDSTKVDVSNIDNSDGTAQINFKAKTTSNVTITVNATSSVGETASTTFEVKVLGTQTQTGTATYTITSTSTVSSTGEPVGSSASYSQTYGTQKQMTNGQSTTLTLSGYDGCVITGMTFSMKSNKSSGAGYLVAQAGTTSLATIGSSGSGVAFSNSSWHGSYSQSYVDVEINMSNTTHAIGENEEVEIFIEATENSLYIESYTIEYSYTVIEDYTPILSKIELSDVTENYYVGDPFINPSITAYYDDQSTKSIDPSDAEISGYNLNVSGTQTVLVSYTEDGVTATKTYEITIEQPTLTSISISGAKTSFNQGETFTTGSSFKVTASYNHGSDKVVTSQAVVSGPTPVQMNTPGSYTVTVSYTEGNVTESDSYTVTVNGITLSSIQVTTNPTKMSYYVNDTFDSTGMVVTATYSNSTTADVTSSVSYKTEALTAGDASFSISYTEGDVTKSTTITLTILAATVTLNNTTLSGFANGTPGSLTASGSNFKDAVTYSWTSSNTSVATVTPTGSTVTVTYSSEGNTTITCSASDGSQTVTATCAVTVSASLSVSLSPTSLSLVEGGTGATTITTNGTISSVVSGTTSVATVSRSNNTVTVTAVSAGSSTITVTVSGGGTTKTATCSVSVAALSVSLSPTSLSLTVGGSTKTFTITTNGTINSVVSGTTSVATVSRSNNTVTVTPVGAGNSTVTVTVKSGSITKTATCAVTVTSSATPHTNTWTATSGAISGTTSGTIENGNFDWSFTRSKVVYTGFNSSCIQLGSKSGAETVTLTNSHFPGKITSVAVECSSYNGAHTVSIKVGSTTYLNATNTSSWTTVGTKTGTGTSSGTVTITFTAGSRALYIKSITVIYES